MPDAKHLLIMAAVTVVTMRLVMMNDTLLQFVFPASAPP